MGCLDLEGIRIIMVVPPVHPEGVEKSRYLVWDGEIGKLQKDSIVLQGQL